MKIDIFNTHSLFKVIQEEGKDLFIGLSTDKEEQREQLNDLCRFYADTLDYVYLMAYTSTDEVKGSYYKAMFNEFFFPGLRAARTDMKFLIISTPAASDHSDLERELARLAASRDCVLSINACANKLGILCGDSSYPSNSSKYDTLVFAFPLPKDTPKYDSEYVMKWVNQPRKKSHHTNEDTVTIEWPSI